MSEETTHFQVIKKVKTGHCPLFPLCGNRSESVFLTTNWKYVTCRKCKDKKK